MRLLNCGNARYRLALAAFLVIASLQLFPLITYAQNPADHIESIACLGFLPPSHDVQPARHPTHSPCSFAALR